MRGARRYKTPLHPNGITDTSSSVDGPLGLKFNPRVSIISFLLIAGFVVWCMVHQVCDMTDQGSCSYGGYNEADCAAFGSISWTAEAAATTGSCSDAQYTTEETCEAACDNCGKYYPGSDEPACPCPCPTWTAARPVVPAHCSGVPDDKEYSEALCNELIANRPVWTVDPDAGEEIPLMTPGSCDGAGATRDACVMGGGNWTASVAITAEAAAAAEDMAACTALGGDWVAAVAERTAAQTPESQQTVTAATAHCKATRQGCPAANTKWDTEDALGTKQDWDASSEFSSWKKWVAGRFTWLYIGSQDVWSVFIIYLLFSKYGDIKLGKDGDEPEFSDASWFTMLFCSGIGVGLFYFGVAEPVWHYIGYGRYNMDPAVTDVQNAQDSMNLTYYHWGIHGFVVYTLVGLSLGLVSHRWGLPMTMKSCLYPLLGDKIFGWIGDAIDVLSIITTLFGVCTSLGLGVTQLSKGLHRMTCDQDAGCPATGEGSGIVDGLATQTWVIWFITLIAIISVVSGIERGIQRLSNLAFVMGCMIMFIGLYTEDTWFLLNVFVQSVGYYFQWIIQLGFYTAAWVGSTSPLEYNGQVMKPSDADVGGHTTAQENPAWMDWWTIFYWGWWIAWSPFVGTFMAKISKGRTVRQFIMGTLTFPVLYGFIWFAIFGGSGIRMQRDYLVSGASTDRATMALIEMSTLPEAGGLEAATTTLGWTVGECPIQAAVNDCEADANCAWQYIRRPTTLTKLSTRSKEDMWFDMMESYGEPDGAFGKILNWFSMFALVCYFVTSSDSGSLVIDCLAANGVDEPPTLQRIFWALCEGFSAMALLQGGGPAAISALSTASIVTGLPYTILLCFICVSTFRGLQMDQKEIDCDKEKEFNMELADIFTEPHTHLLSVVINTLFPTLQIAKHGNAFYTVASAGCTVLVWLCFIIEWTGIEHGWWSAAWMFYTMLALIVMDVRTKARTAKGATGNIVEDFFAALLFMGGALTQLAAEPDGKGGDDGTDPKADDGKPTQQASA